MNRNTSLAFFSAAAVLLIAGSASAWESRVLTLGDQNRWIEDDANIWLYPQKVMNYGDRLYLDLARKNGSFVSSAAEGKSGSSSTTGTSGQSYEGELNEGLDAIQSINGGFFLDLTDRFHMAFWASQYTDMTMYDYLKMSEEVQDDGWMSGQSGLDGDSLRGYMDGINRKVDMFAGWQITPNFDLGAHLWWGSGKYDYLQETVIGDNDKESEAKTWDSMTFGAGLGASIDLYSDSILDIGFEYAHYAYTMDHNTILKPDVTGGNQIAVNSRWSTRLSKYWYFVPALQFRYLGIAGAVTNQQDGKKGLGDNTTDINLSSIGIDLGLGLQMKVINKASLYTVVGLDYSTSTLDGYSYYGVQDILTYSTLQLPYWRTGFEAPVFSWLDLRAGFIKRWGTFRKVSDFNDPGAEKGDSKRDNRSIYEEETYSLSEASKKKLSKMTPDDMETFVGSTIHYAGWYFTTEIDPEMLFKGPLNGAAGGNWFARFDISYRF